LDELGTVDELGSVHPSVTDFRLSSYNWSMRTSHPTIPKAKRKIATRGVVPSPRTELQSDGLDEFSILMEESEHFCESVGLHKDLIRQIIRTDTDWAFILKIDALLESAAKYIVRTGLRIKLLNRVMQNEALDAFVDNLPINGRNGILKLLDAAQLPPEELGFVENIRKVRNIYAHDISSADTSLIDLVKNRNDKSQLLKYLSGINTYVEKDLIARYERDPGFLRFCVINSTMRFLFYSYHMAVKFPSRR
jgi:hypothetical protein